MLNNYTKQKFARDRRVLLLVSTPSETGSSVYSLMPHPTHMQGGPKTGTLFFTL